MKSRKTSMRIVIPGGSGQVGSVLTRALRAEGHQVTILSRNPTDSAAVAWDGKTLGTWTKQLDGADAVINLAGHTVNCRYSKTNRERILQSRIDSTRIVGEAIQAARQPPRTWLQASTATIYSHRFDAPNDEVAGELGGEEPGAPSSWKFSIDVATAWERALDAAKVPGTRKIKLRSAMTMSPDSGGIFDTLLGLVRCGLGGTSGDGRQFVSWIHHTDFTRAILWLIQHKEIAGVVNIASPHPLLNAELMRSLREAWGIRVGLPASRWMLELGAIALRTETELILKSRRVVPGVLTRSGFNFVYPTWPDAACKLCQEWRKDRRNAPGRFFTQGILL